MTEELHEITYAPTIIDRLTRDEIEEAANLEVMDYFSSVMRAKVLACREWLANNPQGMTRDEFNALPDGSVVRLDDSIEYIKVGNRLGLTNHFDRVAWLRLDDQSLANMTVVSTPAAPTLDDADVVRDKRGGIWVKSPNGWGSGASVLLVTDDELLTQFGPLTPLLPGPRIGGEA